MGAWYELSLGSAQHGAEFRHSNLHCNPESGGSNRPTSRWRAMGLGLRATLNCCTVTGGGYRAGKQEGSKRYERDNGWTSPY